VQRKRIVIAIAGVFLAAVYLWNASWLAPAPTGNAKLLAHRGVHQTFRREGLTPQTCTAKRINPPTNPYLENTLPSMRASFAKGADIIELDVHPTTDGEFAVFHDWGLECRTEGKGVTRKQSMEYLKRLDLGYGYTADGGKTFPFRGKGVGMMPTLNEVFSTYPGKKFMINVKSRDRKEARQLIAYLAKRGYPTDERLWVFADGPVYHESIPSNRSNRVPFNIWPSGGADMYLPLAKMAALGFRRTSAGCIGDGRTGLLHEWKRPRSTS
jgi:glycerophosphoryl diester phosphodiesterase